MNFKWLDILEYPFTSNYFNINGHKLHYIDEGKGDIIIFVHGTPSWSFDYRNIIKKLKLNFRCVALDHIGFGLSEKPAHYDYSTLNHSLTLEKFILDQKFENITLVVHDFGGPIGLNFAIKHPEKIKNLVILNSWLWSSKEDPEFIKLSKVLKSPLLPLLYRYFNFSPRFILPQSFGENKLSKHILNHYCKPFANKSQRTGTIAFALSLLNDQNWFQQLWDTKQEICKKPTLFIWGMKDPVIKPKYLEKFISGFSQSEIVKLETAGHFAQEEQPEKVYKAIFEFLKR
jgi:pimeloyl-ACP methyl ester carboxylesterase